MNQFVVMTDHIEPWIAVGCIVEVWEGINKFIPHSIMDVTIHVGIKVNPCE